VHHYVSSCRAAEDVFFSGAADGIGHRPVKTTTRERAPKNRRISSLSVRNSFRSFLSLPSPLSLSHSLTGPDNFYLIRAYFVSSVRRRQGHPVPTTYSKYAHRRLTVRRSCYATGDQIPRACCVIALAPFFPAIVTRIFSILRHDRRFAKHSAGRAVRCPPSSPHTPRARSFLYRRCVTFRYTFTARDDGSRALSGSIGVSCSAARGLDIRRNTRT